MKTFYTNCFLPLSGARGFAVEDGRFTAAVPPFDSAVDLGGAFVLPAFPDAHSHILAYALSLLQADGGACISAADYAVAAEDFAAAQKIPADALVTVKNADVFPDAEALDAIPRPLHLQARSGHAGMFNAAARRMLGLKEAGALEETPYLAATRLVPMPSADAVAVAFRRAQNDYLARGYSLAQEGLLTREMFPVYSDLLSRDTLVMDVIAYAAPNDYDEAAERFPPQGKCRLKTGGMKIFLDGSPQQKTALLRAPYVGGGAGEATMTAEEVLSACRFAAERGAQLLAHCNGDGAAEAFLAALEALPPEARERIRPVLIHAQILGEDQLDRMARLPLTLSFFPAHIRYWGETHLANLGKARAQRISPARDALLRGIPFTLHQDSPVCKPDPLEAAACAVCRLTKSGKHFRGQEISLRAALTALSEGAARQYGFSNRGGTEAGMRADFLVMDRDPLAAPAEAVEQTCVNEVYLCGERVFRRTR